MSDWALSFMVPDTCARLPNWSRRAVVAAGQFAAQGSMIRIDWPYPIMALPVCFGCVSFGMVYYDIAPGGILGSTVSIVANSTFWAGGVVAQHLGEPAGEFAFLHLVAAYEWFLHGAPRGAPATTRVQTASQKIRLSEYQEARRHQMSIADRRNQREYESIPDAQDALTAHRYTGFGDMNSFRAQVFLETSTTLVVIEIDMDIIPPVPRALIFPSAPDEFALAKAMTLGVWRDHTPFLLPSAETTPSSWIAWVETVGAVAKNRGPAGKPPWASTNYARTMNVRRVRFASNVSEFRLRKLVKLRPGATAAERLEPRDAYGARCHGDIFQPVLGIFPNSDRSRQLISPPSPIADLAAQMLGRSVMPDCTHMWRADGPGTHTSHMYATDLPGDFSIDRLFPLATDGGNLAHQCEGLRPELLALQE